jgi:hypothetical protein
MFDDYHKHFSPLSEHTYSVDVASSRVDAICVEHDKSGRPQRNQGFGVMSIDGLVKLNTFVYGMAVEVIYAACNCEKTESVGRPVKAILLRQRP